MSNWSEGDGRWLVLAELVDGGDRYQDLHEALGGISYKVLTDTLRRAERNGLIGRRLDPGTRRDRHPLRPHRAGRSLDEPLDGLTRWIDANWELVVAAAATGMPVARESDCWASCPFLAVRPLTI